MSDIKELLEKAKELDAKAIESANELCRLKNEQRKIAFDNLKNIVYPFVKEYVEPVHKLYHKVSYRNREHFSYYSDCDEVWSKTIGGHSGEVLKFPKGRENIYVCQHCSFSHNYWFDWHEKYGFFTYYSKNVTCLDLKWFELVGTVEKAQALCDEMKEVALIECARLIEMLEYENNELSETVEQVKKAIEESSSVNVSEVDSDVTLVLNGKSYKCIPAND